MRAVGLLLGAISMGSHGAGLETLTQVQAGYIDWENNVRPSELDFDSQTYYLQGRVRSTYSLSDDWSAFADVRVLLTDGDRVFLEDDIAQDNEITDEDNVIGELRQLFVRYSGLTDYPGEHLTLGLQRLREASGTWWDADIESIAWQGDTTQLDWLLAAGQQFDRYRSDADLVLDREDVFRLFGEVNYDWQAYHKITLRGAYADQSNDDLNVENYRELASGINATRYWLSAGVSSAWYERRQPGNLAYHAEYTVQQGEGDFRDTPTSLVERDIDAYAFDTGVRYDFASMGFSLGATYMRASGGGSEGETENYSQTGIHTNRANMTGNREFLFRYNEALRADMGNLTHASLFASLTLDDHTHAVASVGRFRRTDDQAPIFVSGRPLAMVDGEDSVGTGYDVSVMHFPQSSFGLPMRFVRLRASSFNPSSALVEQNNDHRITLEVQFVL